MRALGRRKLIRRDRKDREAGGSLTGSFNVGASQVMGDRHALDTWPCRLEAEDEGQ